MRFPRSTRSGDVALRAERLTKAFELSLFRDLSFQIERGQRWGIVGPNAIGKTTLLRCLLGEEELDAGRVFHGTGVQFCYYDQGLKGMDVNLPVFEAVRPPARDKVLNNQDCRDILARFGIKGEVALQSVGSLSGGERSRAALGRLAAAGGNFLVLDEPTNHLDLWARDALERALREFDGTVLVVSHDRFFLNRVVDHILVAEGGNFRLIHGNYDTYVNLMSRGTAQEPDARRKRRGSAARAKEKSTAGKERRRRRFPYRKVEDLEGEILERESRLEELHSFLTRPEILRDGEKVRAIKAEITEQTEALPGLYEHWEEATELN